MYLAVKLLWNRFPQLQNRRIASFATTEFTTSWQFLYSLRFLRGKRARARMFEQLLEEYHHADIFLRLAQSRSDRPVFLAQEEIAPLFDGSRELWKLVVYSHVGEEDAVKRFSSVAAATNDAELKSLIRQVLADEARHSSGVKRLAEELGRSPGELKAVHWRIRARRAWEGWIRSGSFLSGLLTNLSLLAVYFSCGWLLVWPSRRRLQRTGLLRQDALQRAL